MCVETLITANSAASLQVCVCIEFRWICVALATSVPNSCFRAWCSEVTSPHCQCLNVIWCPLGKMGLMSHHDYCVAKRRDSAKAPVSVLQWSRPTFHCKYVPFPTARVLPVPRFFILPCGVLCFCLFVCFFTFALLPLLFFTYFFSNSLLWKVGCRLKIFLLF